jgi:hypothetical protein
MESPADHQMDDEPNASVEFNRDALSDAPKTPHAAAIQIDNRRARGP